MTENIETHVRIKVCIPFRDPGSAFDDCVESVLLQDAASFDVVFIDDGSQDDHAHRIPLERPGVDLLRHDTPIGFEACIDRVVASQCGPNDVVVPVSYTCRLASRDVIRRISESFEDEECQLLYGQHRLPCGRLGDAEPAADEEDFLQRRTTLASRSPIVFRARLWKEHSSGVRKNPPLGEAGHCDVGTRGSSVFDALMKAGAFRTTRFSDSVFTSIADPAVAPGPGGTTTARESRHAGEESRVAAPDSPQRKAFPGGLPTVSCLMVTRDRLALAKRAMRCFAHQTYRNRELAIVTDGELRVRQGLERFVPELGLEQVNFVYPDQTGMTLGRLRNVAVDAAAGEVLCQWDDDDCYHPDRIRVQVETMLTNNGRACCLTDHLQFLDKDQVLLWLDWTLRGKSRKTHLVPGTIVMFKDDRFRYPESGPFARRGEDSLMLNELYDAVPVVAAKAVGYLYLYTYHGRNTFNRDHHYGLRAFSRSVSELRRDSEVIRGAMSEYPVPKPYDVVGRDGLAFVVND